MGKQLLLILSSTIPGDLFTKEALVTKCILRKIIYFQSLLDTSATNIAFIDKAIAHYVCKVLNICFIKLIKPKPLKGFDSRPAPPITQAIYPTLTVQNYIEELVPLFVTKLGQYPIIFDKPWIKKHGVILDMSCDKFIFWPRYCQHAGAIKKSKEKGIPNLAVKDVPNKSNLMPTIVEYPELLFYVLLEHKGVSKIAISLKVVVLSRQILKQGLTSIPVRSKEKKL